MPALTLSAFKRGIYVVGFNVSVFIMTMPRVNSEDEVSMRHHIFHWTNIVYPHFEATDGHSIVYHTNILPHAVIKVNPIFW